MKDLGAEYSAGREGVQLFGLLSLYLEQEQRFQPREKGLSLIEATPEVSARKGSFLRQLTGLGEGRLPLPAPPVDLRLKAAEFLKTKICLLEYEASCILKGYARIRVP